MPTGILPYSGLYHGKLRCCARQRFLIRLLRSSIRHFSIASTSKQDRQRRSGRRRFAVPQHLPLAGQCTPSSLQQKLLFAKDLLLMVQSVRLVPGSKSTLVPFSKDSWIVHTFPHGVPAATLIRKGVVGSAVSGAESLKGYEPMPANPASHGRTPLLVSSKEEQILEVVRTLGFATAQD